MEIVYTLTAYPGFKSPTLRQNLLGTVIGAVFYIDLHGGMAERLNAAVSKTVYLCLQVRGFKSLSLRHFCFLLPPGGAFFMPIIPGFNDLVR